MISSSSILSLFEVGEKIAGSKRTEVYRGRRLESGDPVAIKLIRVAGLSQAELRRKSFESRSRALQELRIPSLPRVVDLGRTDDGDLYVALEWVEGERLEDSATLRTIDSLGHFAVALEGLRALADRGLSLLNLRPSNFFVGSDGATFCTGLGTAYANPDGRTENGGKRTRDRYRAPEIDSLRSLEAPGLWRADVYSFAISVADLLEAQVRGAGGPVPYVKLPAALESSAASAVDLGMLLERALHQRPDRRPDWSQLLGAIELCRYDLEGQAPARDEAGEEAAGADTQALPTVTTEVGVEVEVPGADDEDRAATAAEAEAEAAEDGDGESESFVGSLRKMWSEGLADIDLKKEAEAIGRRGQRVEADPVVADEGTLITTEPGGEDAAGATRDVAGTPREVSHEDAEVSEGVRPAARQPAGGLADVADEVAALLGDAEESQERRGEARIVTGEIDLVALPPEPASEVAAETPPTVETGDLLTPAELETPAEAAIDDAAIDDAAIAEGFEPSPAEPAIPEVTATGLEEDASSDEPATSSSAEAAGVGFEPEADFPDEPGEMPADPGASVEPAVDPDLREPVLSDVDSAVVAPTPEPAFEPAIEPAIRHDPYRIPFFVAAAAAGLLLIAFLWSLFRTPPSFDPDLSEPVDLVVAEASNDPQPRPPQPVEEDEPPLLSGTATTDPESTEPATESDPGRAPAGEPAALAATATALPESVVADLPAQPETAIPTDRVTSPVSEPESGVQDAAGEPEPARVADPAVSEPAPRAAPPATVAPVESTPIASTPPPVRELAPDSVAPKRADLQVALGTGDLPLLRSTLGRLTASDRDRLLQDGQGRTALQFARLVSDSVDEIEAALSAGRGVEALADADRLARQFPAIESSLALRDRAARWIENRSERLTAEGRLDEAEALLRELEERWPDRADLGSRLRTIQNLQREAQTEVALAELTDLERQRLPHAALERLAALAPRLEAARAAELRERFETQLEQMDRSPPRIEIDPNYEVVLDRDRPLVLRLRVDDDYLVERLSTHVRGAGGVSREVEAERLGSRVFRLVVPAELHGNQRIALWAEAVDYRGHVGRLGSASDPVKVKMKRQ